MNANNDPRDLWKRNEAILPEPLATEICALARRRERESVWGRRISLFALAGFAIAFAHNTWKVNQPWVRLGQGWMLTVMTVCLWNLIRNRTHLRASNEACGGFLLRSLKMKRDGYVAFRRIVLLIIPAILASWWGGGAALKARAMGLDPSSPYYRYLTSVWPMIATCVLLLFVWLAFSGAAKKASAEFEALRQRVAAT
jgi:uncharacterized membrane protein